MSKTFKRKWRWLVRWPSQFRQQAGVHVRKERDLVMPHRSRGEVEGIDVNVIERIEDNKREMARHELVNQKQVICHM